MDEGLGVQSVEDFWGLELSSKRKKMEWQLDSEDECEDDLEKTLELRQACLGATAKEGERNVVEVTADDEDGEEVTHAILSMRVGGTEQTQLFLTLKPPVKFELVAGSGPVHLVGTLTQVLNPWFTGSDEESDSEEREELSSPEVKKKLTTTIQSKKRPASSPLKKLAKVPKRSKKEEESEEESGEEEDSMDVSTSSAEPGKEKALKGGKKDAEEEEESEDEEDEEEDDDSEEEDEDTSEEEESEEEEEEEVKKPVKKPQMNGKLKGKPMPGKTTKLAKTPQPSKPMASKLAAKGSQSAPTTPKTMDKASKKPAKASLGLDQIKQKLLKMSNLPKKMEKFNNFVSHSFKVADDSEKKQLWEFVQKNNLRK